MQYDTKTVEELYRDLKQATDNHFDAARECSAVSNALGWLAPLLAAAAGAAFVKGFASAGTAAVIAFASVLVGALKQAIGSQYEKRAEKHRKLGGQFAGLQDAMHLQIAKPNDQEIEKIVVDKKAILASDLEGLPARIYYLSWTARLATYAVAGAIIVAIGWSFFSSVRVVPAPDAGTTASEAPKK